VTAPVLVLAIGNPSRGDDALGPTLAQRLEDWLGREGIGGVEVITDLQLNVEHALDLEGRERVLVIDASTATDGPPCVCAPVHPQHDASYSTHSVSPQAILQVAHDVGLASLPPTELLAVRGASFELGEALSPAGRRHLEVAWMVLQDWCRKAAGVTIPA
jgi:hydrogenase maturation protease